MKTFLFSSKQKTPAYVMLFVFCLFSFAAQSQNGTWTWMHGSSANNQPGSFGVQGVAAPGNDPPSMYEACEWTDLQGNFWIYGGLDPNFIENTALWKFDPVANMWTWMKGPTTVAQPGNYGVQGVPAPGNLPGSRAWGVMTWVDQAGDLWMMGGYGYDAFGVLGALNDLWRYNIATNTWTWMKGSNLASDPGTYGALQVAAPANVPPCRFEANTCWTSTTGDLWCYGGGNFTGYLNDMWRYNIGTNQWAWMSGPNTYSNPPNWGVQFVPSPANTPGGRYVYSKWIDNSGNFWLFG
ncbi:MAG: kelch repeat-containing protein, partial [Bacteroidia bacterium]